MFTTIDIAHVCHDANRAYCRSLGEWSQPTWDEAPQWQRDSAVDGVLFHLANPDVTPEQSHENWMAEKVANGWIYGPTKDAEGRLHPSLRPYNQLPVSEQAKDHLFKAIVTALAPFHALASER